MRWKEAEDRRRGSGSGGWEQQDQEQEHGRLRERGSREEGAETRKGSNQQKEGQGTVGWRFACEACWEEFGAAVCGTKTVCKPGGRIEQMVSEVEKRDDKEEAVIVHVGTNNLRMDETEEIMKKYEEMIQRLKEERVGEVVVMGILPRRDLSEALERKRVEVNRGLKQMCGDGRVGTARWS